MGGQLYDDRGCIFKPNENEEYPFIIIDLKNEISVQLTTYFLQYPSIYDIGTMDHNIPIQWKIEGSNDLKKWTIIQHETRDRNTWTAHSHWERTPRFNIRASDTPYFSKFKITLTASCWNSNRKILAIKSIKLYGNVRRKSYKLLQRENEIKEAVSFPKIPTKRCIGDPNKVLTILNEWDGIQHNEYKEYEGKIPDLKIELKDYQKRGLSWMIDMEDNGNNDGIHGGLLC